jgi:broad specificity phosphatase PhoE
MRNFILIALLLTMVTYTDAKPAQVIIIRHAEKPEEGDHLSVKGMERAAALAPYFLNTPPVLEYGKPVALYATNVTPDDKSFRTQETLAPLAKELNLEIKHPYTKDQYADLAREILNNKDYEGKMVLIAWEHHNIPALAKALGVNPEPSRWHGKDFDRVWTITYKEDGRVKFNTFSQELMYHDASNR